MAGGLRRHQWQNRFQAVALLLGMAALLAAIGWMLAGLDGCLATLIAGAAYIVVNTSVSPERFLRAIGARRLDPAAAPWLYAVATELWRRAGLTGEPRIYLNAELLMQAFTVGNRPQNAVIVVAESLIRGLGAREVVGVLAHEISHIQNRDILVMGFADLVSRFTRSLTLLAILLILFNMPLFLMGEAYLPWPVILLLLLGPSLSSLLQLALSRRREFDADAGGARLSGDPLGLASALRNLELQHQALWRRLLPGRPDGGPSMLRSHPHSAERIERLLLMTPSEPPLSALQQAPRGPLFSSLTNAEPSPLRRIARWWW